MAVNSVRVRAFAKINLSLDIIGVQPNSYHTVEMVMQSIDLSDIVEVKLSDEIKISSNDETLPSNEDNLCYKAIRSFYDYTGLNSGAQVHIKKNIPIAAGLGGGSTDAAAVINALNILHGLDLSTSKLQTIASEVGADVPFCITGGTQLAEGIGTILTPLPELSDIHFVIVKNGTKMSTKDMYEKFDSLHNVETVNTRELVEGICENNIQEISKNLKNVFEPLWGDQILEIKNDLLKNNALEATLSGSGPSVFGLFDKISTANKCALVLEEKYDSVFVCSAVPSGFEEI